MFAHAGCFSLSLLGTALVGCGESLEDEAAPPAVDVDALTSQNGVRLNNGLNLSNGYNPSNGINPTNGVNLTNGLNLSNGYNPTNGINLSNSIKAPDGVTGPYMFAPSGSDLEKWIDSAPTNNLLVIRYMVECALPTTGSVRVKYRGTLYGPWAGLANLGADIQNGQMSIASQEKVTSCLLARINAAGQKISVNLLGPMTGFNTNTTTQQSTYHYHEGVFGGNLFAKPSTAYFFTSHANPCSSRVCKVDAATCIYDAATRKCGVVTFLDWANGALVCANGSATCGMESKYYTSISGGGRDWTRPITTKLDPKPAGATCTFNAQCDSLLCNRNTAKCMSCSVNSDCNVYGGYVNGVALVWECMANRCEQYNP